MPLFLALLGKVTAGDPERTRRALAGLRRYQEATRTDPPVPMPAVAGKDGATLRDYGGTDDDTGPPVLFVPSLINPPGILDLEPERSLLRWLAARGHRPLLLDWGWPDEARRSLSVAGHVEQILLPLIRTLKEPPHLVGYCLGGTMAAAAAALTPVRSLALIAAPWRFAAYAEAGGEALAPLWAGSRATVDALGLLPMEVLQSAFWQLDPERTIAKFEAFATLDEESARRFVLLEDWANDGPPLAGAAARELFEDMFAADRTGAGRWRVGGADVDPSALAVPILDIVSASDRIVPAASAMGVSERLELDLGHVGMVIGSRAPAMLWEPLSAWLSRPSAKC